MTSRRIISNEKTILDQDDQPSANNLPPGQSSVAPAVPLSVILNLIGFTIAMLGGPIGTYFLTLNTIFKGNSTFAGGAAAFMANVVLIAYVIVAMKMDQGEQPNNENETKKGR